MQVSTHVRAHTWYTSVYIYKKLAEQKTDRWRFLEQQRDKETQRARESERLREGERGSERERD